MKNIFTLLLTGICVGISSNVWGAVEGVVNADLLNLRQAPGFKSVVMGKIHNGDKVKILRLIENWAELEVPNYLPMYVSEALISNGKTISEVNLRSAKAVEAPSFGILPKGYPVTMLQDRAYGWVRIVPPAGLKVYAAKMFISFDRKQLTAQAEQEKKSIPATATPDDKPVIAPSETTKTDVAPQKVENPTKAENPVVKTVSKEPAPLPEVNVPAPKKLTGDQQRELIRLGANVTAPGQHMSVAGKLCRVEFSDSTATDYAIMSGSDNLGFIFWIPGSARNDLLNQEVRIQGISYTIAGAKAPVIVPEKIDVVAKK